MDDLSNCRSTIFVVRIYYNTEKIGATHLVLTSKCFGVLAQGNICDYCYNTLPYYRGAGQNNNQPRYKKQIKTDQDEEKCSIKYLQIRKF